MTPTSSPQKMAARRAPRATYSRTAAASPSARARATIGNRMRVMLKSSWYGRNAKVWHSL